MNRPQSFNFPFPFYGGYQNKYNGYPFMKGSNPPKHSANTVNSNVSNKQLNFNVDSNVSNNCPPKDDKSENFKQKNKSNQNTDKYLFDLFGLKIFSDDVLLISLIYFLYSEGVKDDGLFIVLILLLLS